jgi:hypothetical protein
MIIAIDLSICDLQEQLRLFQHVDVLIFDMDTRRGWEDRDPLLCRVVGGIVCEACTSGRSRTAVMLIIVHAFEL